MEQKTFMEVSCIYNIHTGERVFTPATFEGLWIISFQTK